jgi:hypothetical protein
MIYIGWDVRLFGPGYDEKRANAECNLWEGDLNETTSEKFRNEYVFFPENLAQVEPFDQVILSFRDFIYIQDFFTFSLFYFFNYK